MAHYPFIKGHSETYVTYQTGKELASEIKESVLFHFGLDMI